jgi:DNA-directed RNA polymerase specialized sigma24 family protein
MATEDPLGRALRQLDRVLDLTHERIDLIQERIAEIECQRSDGMSYTEIVEAAAPPLFVQLITEIRDSLDGSGARARRSEALALHEEGMTMQEIAERFGVTRQRVSALLSEARRERSET